MRRAIELARLAARGVTMLAVVAAACVGLAWTAWIAGRPPVDGSDWGARIVVLGIALVPSAVLGLFLAGLRELAELPRRARELPPELRTQIAHVRARAAERRGGAGLVGGTVRLARLLLDARELLSPYAVVTAALRPALVLTAAFAAVAAVVEIPVALVSLLFVATS